MKTLKEQVNEIKSANISRNAKKSALAKLGITAYEIGIMLASEPTATMPRTSFTFGVEIECNVIRGSIREAAEVTGMSYEYEGYNHRDGHSYFKFTTDSSVRGENPIECVSPVMQGVKGKSPSNALLTPSTAQVQALTVHAACMYISALQALQNSSSQMCSTTTFILNRS